MSKNDYNNIIQTINFSSIADLKKEIITRTNDDDAEYINESEIQW